MRTLFAIQKFAFAVSITTALAGCGPFAAAEVIHFTDTKGVVVSRIVKYGPAAGQAESESAVSITLFLSDGSSRVLDGLPDEAPAYLVTEAEEVTRAGELKVREVLDAKPVFGFDPEGRILVLSTSKGGKLSALLFRADRSGAEGPLALSPLAEPDAASKRLLGTIRRMIPKASADETDPSKLFLEAKNAPSKEYIKRLLHPGKREKGSPEWENEMRRYKSYAGVLRSLSDTSITLDTPSGPVTRKLRKVRSSDDTSRLMVLMGRTPSDEESLVRVLDLEEVLALEPGQFATMDLDAATNEVINITVFEGPDP